MGKYWWEEDEEEKKQETPKQSESNSYWWEDESSVSKVGESITNRVNTWLKNHDNYITNYKNRFSGRKGSLEDDYVSDSGDWLKTATQQRENFKAEAESILSHMDQYKDYLDAKWMDSVRKTLAAGTQQQDMIVETATKDNEWWNTFNDQNKYWKYGSAEEGYKYEQRKAGYQKTYEGMTSEEISDVIAKLDDGEEREWLTAYQPTVQYQEYSTMDTNALQSEIDAMEEVYKEAESIALNWGMNVWNRGADETDDYMRKQIRDLIGKFSNGQYYTMEELYAAIKKEKYKLGKSQNIQKFNEMSSVAGNNDFSQNSQYVSNVEYSPFGKPEFTDDTYAYVNNPIVEDRRLLGGGDASARSLIEWEDSIYKSDSPLRNRDSSYERDALEHITEEEVAIYNYYYATEGAEKAREYLDLLIDTFKERRDAQTAENASKFAKEHPWISSALSVGTSLGSGFEYIGDIIEYGGDKILGKDAKLDTNEAAIITNAVRESVANEVDWEIGNWDAFDFLYNTTMSGIDSFASMGFGGLGGTVLGLSAAAQGTNDALNRGMSSGQAFWNGLFSGVFEGLFESISIGNFNKLKEVAPKNVKDIFKNIAKSMLVNASEETLTEIANIGYDTLVNGEFANYTMEDLKNGAWKDALYQVIEAGASGALMGFGMSSVASAIGTHKSNKQALEEHGDNTAPLIQEGLESDAGTRSNKLAQKYQKQTESGKAMTGAQIRQLLAANQDQIKSKDLKLIQQAAQKRLTDLGQTENVEQIAELATKFATGQKLSREERSILARSEYGSQVSKDLLPDSVAEWAENIGTREVNFKAYNKENIEKAKAAFEEMVNKAVNGDPATYKSLEERVDKDKTHAVSESGKATIIESDEEISLKNFVAKDVTETDMTIELENGKEVKASGIEYESYDQSHLFSAVPKIENITPAAATVAIKGYDSSSGLSVSEYLNGFDEGFTYGYWNYSEADLQSGNFAPKLGDTLMKTAYEMGKEARKYSDETSDAPKVKMRTEVDAKMTAEQKTAKQTERFVRGEAEVYFMDGESVTYFNNQKTGKIDPKRKAAVNTAKFLSKLGIGGKYFFYESYVNAKGERVYKNANGVEKPSPNGFYTDAEGSIYIDLNAGDYGQGVALFTLGHELTHFVKAQSKKQFKILADLVKEAFDKTDLSMHERVLAKQKFLQKCRPDESISYDEAFEEVVADAMSTMLSDGTFYDKLMEIKVKDKGLFDTIKRFFKNMIAKFTKAYEKLTPDQQDARDIREMKDMFDKIQTAFAEALVEASENYQANIMTTEVGVEPVAVEDFSRFSYRSLAEAAGFEAVENDNGSRAFIRNGNNVSEVTVEDIENSPIGAFINFSLEMGDISEADAKRQKKMFADICTMACKTNDFAMTMQFVGSAVFTGMKANADKQYGTTYDFPSICTKTQAVIDAMSAKMVSLKRGLTTDEIVQLYDDVFASGNPVPCPECYVFSRWIGIGGLLDNIKKYQDYYGDMAVEDVAAEYRKMKEKVSKFAEEQGISFGKAKGALTSKLTKEFNNLTEKVEKQQNQGEKVKPADLKRLEELEPMMNTVKGMTWLENVYFADSSLKKVNPKFRVPDSVLFNLNNGEAFASQYKDAWAFRTTQGAGYGKAITPYAEARLGEGVLVTNNTTNAIKGKAQGSLDNYFLNQMGKLDKKSKDALKRARLKQKVQAFIGGQRFQSTSDARYENASDYLLAALEMQAMSGMVQVYTKVDGAVPAFSTWGFSINQSLMPLNGGLDANGNVKDTSVGGMKPEVAFENRKKHESAGTITIGVNDNHIRAMFKQLVRDFIIPYHASGGKADVVAEFRRIQEGKEAKGKAVRSTDYSRTQSDKVLSDDVLRWQGKTDAQIQRIHEIRNARIAILTGGKVNMTVVRSNRFLSALYDKINGGEWDGVKLAKSKVESQIYPNEFWDQTVTYEESAKITRDYLEYCEDLGFLHRFSGTVPSNGKLVAVNGYDQNGDRVQLTDLAYKYDENGNKTDEVEQFFWKVLTDRRMYDNDGKYLAQKVVTLNDTTTETVTDFARKNNGREYDKAKAEALAKKIVGEKFSMRNSVEETADLVAFHNITPQLLMDVLNRKGLLMPSLAITNKGMTDFGEISLVFDKNTIDPNANSENKLYGADAWTPTQTQLKKNAKFDTNKTVNAVNNLKNNIGSEYVPALFNITAKQFKEAIILADGSIYDAFAHSIGMQTAYAMEKGIISEIPTTKNGKVNKTALHDQLNAELDTDNGWRQYKRWLNNISDTVITSYDKASNEDILRNMKAQPASAKTFKLSENGELVVPAAEYSSIEDMRKNKSRLSENAAEETKAVADEFLALAKEIGNNTKSVVNAINVAFADRYSTSNIVKSFESHGIKISSETAGKLQEMYKKAVELPTQYFEAKPHREVGLNEIETVIMPKDEKLSELKSKLEDLGITVTEYNADSKAERVKALNSVEKVKFSERATDRQYMDAANNGDMTTDGKVKYALRGNYWYPNMLKRELREIEDIAKNEVYKTKNYLGIGTKWLYNKQKGHEYFALYSTNDAKDPTILYACKDDSAEFEYNLLMAEIKKGGYLYGSSDPKSGSIDGLLSRIRNVSNTTAANPNGTVGTGGNSGNASTHSGNRRKRPSAAFENCIKNIEEIQEQASLDEHYQFAIDIGDMDAVQKMVDEAAKKAGYDSPKLYHGTNAFGFTKIDTKKSNDRISFFATDSMQTAGTYSGTSTARNIGDASEDSLGMYQLYANTDGMVEFDANGSESNHIALGQEARDYNDFVYGKSWYSFATAKQLAKYAKQKGYTGVIIKNLVDSANPQSRKTESPSTVYIFFDSKQVKSADPVTYDNSGNVIPLSERFKQENDDIRYSERGEGSSNRSLLANAFETISQNSKEYKQVQEYKAEIAVLNKLEAELHNLNQQIRDIMFSKGTRDNQKLKELEDRADRIAKGIAREDKKLLNMEASAPLRRVIEQERKKAAQKTKEHVKEIQQNKKVRAEQTELRHKIFRVVKELNDLLLNENKKRHVPDSLKKSVAGVLAIVNMDTVEADARVAKYAALIAREQAKAEPDQDIIDSYTVTMENIQRQGEKIGQRIKELRDAYEEIKNSTDPDIANAYDPVIEGAIKELSQTIGDTSIINMTTEQLSDVYDVYRMVLTRVRDANNALLENIKESISALATGTIKEVRAVGGEHTHRAAILDPVKKFLWNNLKPVYAMETIGSKTLTKVFNNVRAGEDVWAKDVSEARAFYLEKSKKYGYDSWDFKKKYKFESAGAEFELTLEQILSLYAYSKREQAHDHLRLGGFVFDSNIETYKDDNKILKYKVNTADAHQITPETLGEITDVLTKDQIGFVDEMQGYLSTVMGAKGNEVTSKMYGVKLFKEKFYFPLKSAKQFVFEQNEVAGEVKIKNSGFTNKVVPKANNPVILNNFMDVWAGHVNDMSMYHAFTLPLEDFNRVFNYNSPKQEGVPPVAVKGTIQNAYGPAAVDYVKNLITDLNGGARTDPATGPLNWLMGRFKKGSVFASLSVTIQQPSAIARATALVDTKYFIGPKVDHKSHKILWDEVKQYAPVAIIKEMGYFDTNMGKSTQDFIQGKEYSGFKAKMKALVTDSDYRDEVLSKAPALADEIAWCGIWEAVKRETKAKNTGMDIKSEEFLKMAGERFTEVITKTQVYDSVLSRSGNMRSKDTGMKMVTAFMAEPTTSINMVTDALLQGKRGNRKYSRKAIGAVVASQLLNAILVSLVYAGRDDDEDETYVEKYIGSVTGEFLDSLNPATYIPFIKDIVSIVQGYDVERSDMAVISDLWNAIENLKSDKVSPYRKVEGFAGSIAQIFGLPVKNIMRDARGIYQTVTSFVDGQQTTGSGIKYAISSAVTGKDVPKQQQIYDVILSGDMEYLERLKQTYKDEKAYHSAVRTALRENDPRIREAALAQIAGDPSERVRIAKLIIADGFDQDDVVMAINAEINKLKEDDSSDTDKAKGYYTTKDFVIEIANGDKASANAVRDDVIQTAITNGKTQEEAEKSFVSSVKSEAKKTYLEGNLSDKAAKDILLAIGEDEEEVPDLISYWSFCKTHPEVDLNQSQVEKYKEWAEPAEIPLKVFEQYAKRTAGIETIKDEWGDEVMSVMDQIIEVIDSLDLTWQQKDALFLSRYSEKNLKYVPW